MQAKEIQLTRGKVFQFVSWIFSSHSDCIPNKALCHVFFKVSLAVDKVPSPQTF